MHHLIFSYRHPTDFVILLFSSRRRHTRWPRDWSSDVCSSDLSVAEHLAAQGRDVSDLRQIVLHLGNGASASAVRAGVPVDTSMGLTPLEGLVMGTRTGDIDPSIYIHLHRQAGDRKSTRLNSSHVAISY